MSKYDRMTDEQLLCDYKNGNQEIMDYLMVKYKFMVRKKARAMYLLGGENEDLIQEGNIGLLIGLDTLGLMEEGLTSEEHLEKEIRHAIRSALDEQEGEKSTGDEITEKLNKMADAISELTEDLGRQVSPDELSLYLDMSLEEIEDLLRIAGETIEVADSPKA